MKHESKKTPIEHFPIVISGAGPAGMLAALALHSIGQHCALIGPAASLDDYRTTTLMMPAIKILEKFCDWQSLRLRSAPLRCMQIIDDTGRLIRSSTVSFWASEVGEDAFGFNIPNKDLNHTLSEAAEHSPFITRIIQKANEYKHCEEKVSILLENRRSIETQLIIAADGRKSLARQAAKIAIKKWSYPQSAVVLSFEHEKEHKDISREFHTRQGPFTQVPLPGKKSSLVWVVSPDVAQNLLKISKAELEKKIEDKMQSVLGKVSIKHAVQAWPLSAFLPEVLAQNRTILIGEAAHAFPPIGAQGLNLTVRDIVDLQNVIRHANFEYQTVMGEYNKKRMGDIQFRTRAVDALNKTLLSNLLSAQILRALGLNALKKSSILRRFFMREGMAPHSAFLRIGNMLGKSYRKEH